MTFTSSAKKYFVDKYLTHLMRVAEKNASIVRDIQSKAGRMDEMVIRVDAFEADVRKRGYIQQEITTRVFRIRQGYLERLPDDTRYDAVVMTDYPTLRAIATGECQTVRPDGSVKVTRPFTPRDAVRMGRLTGDGDASVISNLFLLERTILPRLADELKLPKPPPS